MPADAATSTEAAVALDIVGLTVRYACFDDLRPAAPRFEAEGLMDRERAELAAFRHAGRREAWLCGRLLAKRLLADRIGPGASPHRIEILSRENGEGMRPTASFDGAAVPWTLSISHSDRGVLAALADEPNDAIGVDLVDPEAVRPTALAFWFTDREQAEFDVADRDEIAARWAAKEAAFKALNRGEAMAPLRIETSRHGDTYLVRYFAGDATATCVARVARVDGHVVAVV